jgi:hypothetical protein
LRAPDLVFSGASVVAIMEQPHIPLGLPGYRALMWLGLIVAARILSGRGWATFVGLGAAIGTLMIGRSPDGIWGVLQYLIGAIIVELVLAVRPGWTRRIGVVVVLGAVSLALVGWIAPVGQGFSGGAGVGDLWYALRTMGLTAWGRLIGFDVMFGAGAGLIGVALAAAVGYSRLFGGERRGSQAAASAAIATPSAV